MLRRIGFAVSLVVFVALVVRIGRGGYVDVTGDDISFLDALYYASVTVTTTGYGDITAVSSGARLATVALITPARIVFLILVVGTTVEVLTEQSRRLLWARRWRQRVNDHYVICGFGSTGRSAALDLVSRGIDPGQIVAVDRHPDAVADAGRLGHVAVHGDATKSVVLREAVVQRARAVVIAPNRDDTAVLITLTVRELNPEAHIVAGGREQENLHLLRQGGADEVVDATAAVGRMLGLGTHAPGAVRVIDDLLDAGTGLELVEVSPVQVPTDVVAPGTSGASVGSGEMSVAPPGTTVVAVIRGGVRLRADQVAAGRFAPDDRLVVLRES